MRNIHLIPTPNPSRLYKFEDKLIKNDLIGLYEYKEKGYIGQNICITSDAEIKEGDWCLPFMNGKLDITEEYPIYKMKYRDFYYEDKKIILTTDQDLIKDGVQAIDDEFLKWFVKNSSCKEIEVEIDLVAVNEFGSEITVNSYGFDKFIYKIILPKEKPKQETLLDKVKSLVKEWQERQIKYQDIAEASKDEHNDRKFTYKVMATRDC